MNVNEYFEQNYDTLLNIAKSFNSDNYMDLLHDTYIIVKESESGIRDMNGIKSYIVTVMRRYVKGYYDTANKELASEYMDYNESYDDTTDLEVEDLISRYDTETQCIIRYLMDGYNQKEIANIMGFNYNTLRSKIFRLRNKIRDSATE